MDRHKNVICRALVFLALTSLGVLNSCSQAPVQEKVQEKSSLSDISLSVVPEIGKGIYLLVGPRTYPFLIWAPNTPRLAGSIAQMPMPDCPPFGICSGDNLPYSEILYVDLEKMQARTILTLEDGSHYVDSVFWLPDGEHIGYFELGGAATDERAWSVDLEGKVAPFTLPLLAEPHWSPDGSKIAFAVEGDTAPMSRHKIVVFDIATNEQSEVFSNRYAIRGLSWAPDRESLVLSAGESSAPNYLARPTIQFVDLRTGEKSRLQRDATEEDTNPSFSPTSDLLAFERSQLPSRPPTVVIRDIEANCEIELPAQLYRFSSWSPDGGSILVYGEEGNYIVNLSEFIGRKFQVTKSVCP